MNKVQNNLAKMATGDAKVIAVTKYQTDEDVELAYETGIRDFGENRVDMMLERQKQFEGREITWHLIGNLQRRKVREIIDTIDYFHALDSVKLAQEIEKRATKKVKCFIEVNISREDSKHGIFEEDLEQFASELQGLEKVEIVGIMTMAPYDAEHDELIEIFTKAEQLRLKLKKIYNTANQLSAGMSRDFAEAVECGSTMVRIGSALFV
ncbi:MAG: YggS family pyridoxal phosphate-dependent enzyme [Lactobacillales bacterium]|jgi:pyridoxal phosphate enzyme (YggS family)|nr:YggS family pyridoxal phosphate-dependent enzyme [Lactobacillales bacterium]